MRGNAVVVILVGLAIVLASCTASGTAQETKSPPDGTALSGELIVFAAASLTDAFDALGAGFEAEHPDVEIRFNFAGSQQLAQQLAQGAPADLFASANQTQMDAIVAAERILSEQTAPFAGNQLIIVMPTDNPGAIEEISDLTKSGIKLIVAAEEVPVGRYTQQFLENAASSGDFDPTFGDDVSANIVSYEQSVRAVLSKIILGEADAGIVYNSDVVGEHAEQVSSVAIPAELNVVATYPIAPLTDSAQPALAVAFIDFIQSPEGQSILANYGLLPAAGLNRKTGL